MHRTLLTATSQRRFASTFSGIHRGLRSESRPPSRYTSPRTHDRSFDLRVQRESEWSSSRETTDQQIGSDERPRKPGYGSFARSDEQNDTISHAVDASRQRLKSRLSFPEAKKTQRGIAADRKRLRKSREEEQELRNRESLARSALEATQREDDSQGGRFSGPRMTTDYDAWKEKAGRVPRYLAIPHTTAASQFLYGQSTIEAALLAKRRKLYKLYLVDEQKRYGDGDGRLNRLRKLAGLAGVRVKDETTAFIPMMERLSKGRPHGNCILEASPLPTLPTASLADVDTNKKMFLTSLAPQSREDIEINGNDPRISYTGIPAKYPLVLYLDGITDEGNMGAILRSAYLLGVSAVAIDQRGNAPLDLIALKSASGAAEDIPLLTITSTKSFLQNSRKAGWRVYAADMPKDIERGDAPGVVISKNSIFNTGPIHHDPLANHATILVLSNEETGVGNIVKSETDYFIGVSYPRVHNKIGVDSLNVSAAASVLCLHLGRGHGKTSSSRRAKTESPDAVTSGDEAEAAKLF